MHKKHWIAAYDTGQRRYKPNTAPSRYLLPPHSKDLGIGTRFVGAGSGWLRHPAVPQQGVPPCMKIKFLHLIPAIIRIYRPVLRLILSVVGFFGTAAQVWSQTLHSPGSQHVTSIGASLLATLDSDAGVSMMELGFVYSRTAVNSDPMLGGEGVARFYTIGGKGHPSGIFGLSVSHLIPDTAYTFKAYANPPQGTIYSGMAAFTTTGNHPPVILTNSTDDTLDYSGTATPGIPRAFHMALLLPTGKVLVAGGSTGAQFQTQTKACELFDPATETWTATGEMPTARDAAVAVLLPNGNVLATGGSGGSVYHESAEVYHTASGTWNQTTKLAFGRTYHTATRMADGKVLVAGGHQGSLGYPAPAEIYDPETGTWTLTGSLIAPRFGHSATLLKNGRILIAGGYNANAWLGSVEIYDPTTGVWSATGRLSSPRRYHQQTLMEDGRVLATGGGGIEQLMTSVEIYDPATGTWTPAASLGSARRRHTATLLGNGRVLVCGGEGNVNQANESAEMYSPSSDRWTVAANLAVGRMAHTATLLQDRRILVAGGAASLGSAPLAGAGLYGPAASQPTAAEGTLVSRSGTYSDPEGRLTASLTASQGTITPDPARGSWVWKRTAADGPSSMEVLLTATDNTGAKSSTTLTIPVLNQPPIVTIQSVPSANINQPVEFSFSALDASSTDRIAGFSWSIDYGDGSAPELVPAGRASPLARTHAFNRAGTFVATVSATDKDAGTSAVAVRTIHILTHVEVWRGLHFGTADNNGNAENFADPDNDGVVNLIEYAFGLNPKSAVSAQLPPVQLIGTSWVISFAAPATVEGSVIYGAEWSLDLMAGSWKAISDTGTRGTHTFTLPVEGKDRLFLRMSVREP